MKPKPAIVATRVAVTIVALLGLASSGRFIADNRALGELRCAGSYPDLLLSSRTLGALAMQCVGDAELELAETYALQALGRQPTSQLALASLGSVAELSGDADMADLWFSRASGVGRRDFATSTYWMERFSKQGQPMQVAAHLDAVLRAGWVSELAEDQALRLEASPAGREALLGILTPKSPWAADFLSGVERLSDDALNNRSKMLALIGSQVDPSRTLFSATSAAPAVRELFRRGRIKDSYDLWNQVQPGSTRLVVRDPQFSAVETGASSPFSWTIRHVAGLDLSYGERAGENGGLRMRPANPGRYPVAEQVVRLQPGRYRLLLSGEGEPEGGTSFVIRLDGLQEGETIGARQVAIPTSTNLSDSDFVISGADQFFRLSVAVDVGAGGSDKDIKLNSLTVTKQ